MAGQTESFFHVGGAGGGYVSGDGGRGAWGVGVLNVLEVGVRHQALRACQSEDADGQAGCGNG